MDVYWDNLLNAAVTEEPYPHITCDLLSAETCAILHAHLSSRYNNNKDPLCGGWPIEHYGIPQVDEVVEHLSNWAHWSTILLKLGVQGSVLGFGFQATNPDTEGFGIHNDREEETGYCAKILIYLQDSVGTQIFKREGELAYETEGKAGSVFMFPCNEHSFHGTDFTSLTSDTKRIILGGEFHDQSS